MGKLICLLGSLVVLFGCKSTNPVVQAIVTPLANAGCAVETSLTNSFGTALAGQCNGNATACGPALQVALGNINLCTLPVPATSTAEFKALPASVTKELLANPQWKTIGDIPASALNTKSPEDMKKLGLALGVVGTFLCPIATSTTLGLVSGVIPAGCQCTQSLSASSADAAFNNACQAVMGAL